MLQARLFNLEKPLPFSQGYALREIMRSIGGTVVCFGELETMPEGLEGGTVYYLKSRRGGGIAESLWIDNGCSAWCHSCKIGDDEWRKTIHAGECEIVGGPMELTSA